MTTSAETTAQADRAKVLEELKCNAVFLPRPFAIYGFVRGREGVRPEAPFIGWGVDLGEKYGAFFWNPATRNSHKSRSAERVLEFHQRIGEAHLKWLD